MIIVSLVCTNHHQAPLNTSSNKCDAQGISVGLRFTLFSLVLCLQGYYCKGTQSKWLYSKAIIKICSALTSTCSKRAKGGSILVSTSVMNTALDCLLPYSCRNFSSRSFTQWHSTHQLHHKVTESGSFVSEAKAFLPEVAGPPKVFCFLSCTFASCVGCSPRPSGKTDGDSRSQVAASDRSWNQRGM